MMLHWKFLRSRKCNKKNKKSLRSWPRRYSNFISVKLFDTQISSRLFQNRNLRAQNRAEKKLFWDDFRKMRSASIVQHRCMLLDFGWEWSFFRQRALQRLRTPFEGSLRTSSTYLGHVFLLSGELTRSVHSVSWSFMITSNDWWT
jgi:hypothetical protein